MGILVTLYMVYGAAALGLTSWWARSLYRHGAVVLEDAFGERRVLAHAVNSLVVVGVQLFNLGCALLLLRVDPPADALAAFDLLAGKLGGLLLVLAVVHALTVLVFAGLRHRALRRSRPAPLPAASAPAPSWAQAPAAWSTPARH